MTAGEGASQYGLGNAAAGDHRRYVLTAGEGRTQYEFTPYGAS